MNRQKWIILLAALAMIGGVGATLHRLKAGQTLGAPGIKTSRIPGSQRLDIYLPEDVLNYGSTNVPTDQGVLDGLPHDTSFAQRHYEAPGDQENWLGLMAVLMGTDRTSIHKPQFCLKGSGWDIDAGRSSEETIRIERPRGYDLPVTKLVLSQDFMVNGARQTRSGIYVYWFVADGQLTARHTARMWSSARHLLATGELQRWAYIGCLADCRPGDEDATYERMKKFIAAAVPEFQLVTGTIAAAPSRMQLAAHE
jgi:hypothetical protein